jgi:CubicO group peptidase (beta-lactamase class C family)
MRPFFLRPSATLVALSVLLLLGSCTLSRRWWYNVPDYNDQFRFPAMEVAAAPEPWPWPEADDLQALGAMRVIKPTLSLETLSLQERLEESPTLAFLVIRNDSILYEYYEEDMDRHSPMTSFSIAKTFVGYLVGVGLEEGWIRSLQDPVQRYLPEVGLPDVTLEHLLNNTSGIDFPPDGWAYYTRHLERLPERVQDTRWPPGTAWRYENSGTQLLAMALEAASGEALEELLASRIWQRIGTEEPLRWTEDGNGTPRAFCCMNATSRDFARFGRLMLHLGAWEGEQLVPRSYLEEAAEGGIEDGQFIRYKYQQWLENPEAGVYFANGLYGQYLYCYPPKNILIVRFAREGPHVHAIWSELISLVIEHL